MNNTLPEWSLADLYDPAKDTPLKDQLAAALAEAEALSAEFKGKLNHLDANSLDGLLVRYQAISELGSKLTSYTDLAFAGNMTDADIGKLAQDAREAESMIIASLVFVEHELAEIDDDKIAALMADPAMARWAPWVRLVRAFRDHQLSLEMETMLIDRQPSGRGAWIRLFDEMSSSLSFPIDDRHVTEAEIIDMMSDPNPETRKKAGMSRAQVLSDNSRT
ncbi:MAG: oligoendopeptidase F, partial [Alphaproteobacteria bacterium]|nr:oligoendopeptidase F [Alphaproteobacteria bacterium]